LTTPEKQQYTPAIPVSEICLSYAIFLSLYPHASPQIIIPRQSKEAQAQTLSCPAYFAQQTL
jgi:hypothetical protein